MSSRSRDNLRKSRFELGKSGQAVFASYRREDSVLIISHVEAPIPLRGTGAAGELMRGIVEIARAEGRKGVCRYAVIPQPGYASIRNITILSHEQGLQAVRS